jgi:hypothetical protein
MKNRTNHPNSGNTDENPASVISPANQVENLRRCYALWMLDGNDLAPAVFGRNPTIQPPGTRM